MSSQHPAPGLGLGIPTRQLSITTSTPQAQRNTLTAPQTSPVRSSILPSPSPSHSHTPVPSHRTTSSSIVSPSSSGAPTPVTAPPISAHVPGLGEDCFLDLTGIPTPPPSIRARAGSVGIGPGPIAGGPAAPRGVEAVARAPQARLQDRWKAVEPPTEQEAENEERAEAASTDQLDEMHLRALQDLADGSLTVEDRAHALRGSHSFDSVSTARVHSPGGAHSPDSAHTPTAVTPATSADPATSEKTPRKPKYSFVCSYPTLVFDVLQTYDGSELSSPRTRAKEPAAFEEGDAVNPLPPDDPRFILWSTPAPASTSLPRQSAYLNVQQPPPPSPAGPVRRTLLACTLERWIAQLTSSLDYDILLDTLISYRPFLPPSALARLLIARFMWTLQPPPTWLHPADVQRQEVVRKIVRLRTMLVMRCWLQVFFRVDFVHNKEARDVLVGWMNRMEREPEVQARDDVLKLVRRLKRIVRECKDAYNRDVQTEFELGMKDSPIAPSAAPLPPARSNSHPVPPEEQNTDDIDLSDLSPRPSVDYDRLAGRTAAEEYAHLATYGKPNPSSKGRESIRGLAEFAPALVPATQVPLLIPNSTAVADPLPAGDIPPVGLGLDLDDTPMSGMGQVVPTSPNHHGTGHRGALSRAMGKLKRAVAGKSSPVSAVGVACTGPDAAKAFLEDTPGVLNAAMLVGRTDSPPPVPRKEIEAQQVEYLAPMVTVEMPAQPLVQTETVHDAPEEKAQVHEDVEAQNDDTIHDAEAKEAVGRSSEEFTPSLTPASPTSSEPVDSSGVWEKRMADRNGHEGDAHAEGSEAFSSLSIGTDGWQQESMTSLESGVGGHEHTLGGNHPPHVISLDDWDSELDIDSSDEDDAPVQRQPKRLPRRLPLRRELDERPVSIETVSSLGIRSFNDRDSVISATFPVFKERERELGPRNPLLEGPLAMWQLDLIGAYLESEDEEGEAGDAASALAKLEGQIDQSRQAQRWKRAGEFIEEAAVIAQGMVDEKLATDDTTGRSSKGSTIGGRKTINVTQNHATPENAVRPPASSPARPHASSIGASTIPPVPSPASYPMNHISLILIHNSTDLAEAFCLIDCEMTLAVRFEEILHLEWYSRVQAEPDVLDWATFIKTRAVIRYELQQKQRKLRNQKSNSGSTLDAAAAGITEGQIRKLSDIAAIKARFNLMVHWVAHELLLTHPSRRPELVNKIIRIAIKAYRMNSFATVLPIVHGLCIPEASIAMRKLWPRVGAYEMRMFTALKEFCKQDNNFGGVRAAVSRLIEEPGNGVVPASVRAALATNGKQRVLPTTCVPFLGVYLSQMQNVSRMPDYIDPTDPPAGIRYNAATNQFYPFKHPDRFANLQPLPADVPLEPLINVEKARKLADIVRNFVAGQHLAVNMRFPEINHSLWKECMSIRRLSSQEVNGRLMAE
ncbi:ras GEF [Calocera cornea HHB12733]|uniref:Ras GEF n=1 Tax=Calocera cornea HHB12733 TaxID=1353952 RepID=A0A165DN29_9BASI|nr:ras GEF [Calocera cornea HHB12733]